MHSTDYEMLAGTVHRIFDDSKRPFEPQMHHVSTRALDYLSRTCHSRSQTRGTATDMQSLQSMFIYKHAYILHLDVGGKKETV